MNMEKSHNGLAMRSAGFYSKYFSISYSFSSFGLYFNFH